MVLASWKCYNPHMRLLFKTSIVFGLLLTSLQSAEWQIEAGAGVWGDAPQGDIVHHGNVDLLGPVAADTTLTDTMRSESYEGTGYFYASLRHSLFLVPDIAFEYVGVQGKGDIAYFSGTSLLPGSSALTSETQLNITQYDTLLFYNLLDSDFGLRLDLGVDIKYMTTRYQVPDLDVDSNGDSVVPLLYMRGSYEILESGLSMDAAFKYITDGSSTLYDLQAKAVYVLPIESAVRPGLELGYRLQRFQVAGESSQLLGDVFSTKSDVDVSFSGLYAGVILKF